jgi:hypothetical protein
MLGRIDYLRRLFQVKLKRTNDGGNSTYTPGFNVNNVEALETFFSWLYNKKETSDNGVSHIKYEVNDNEKENLIAFFVYLIEQAKVIEQESRPTLTDLTTTLLNISGIKDPATVAGVLYQGFRGEYALFNYNAGKKELKPIKGKEKDARLFVFYVFRNIVGRADLSKIEQLVEQLKDKQDITTDEYQAVVEPQNSVGVETLLKELNPLLDKIPDNRFANGEGVALKQDELSYAKAKFVEDNLPMLKTMCNRQTKPKHFLFFEGAIAVVGLSYLAYNPISISALIGSSSALTYFGAIGVIAFVAANLTAFYFLHQERVSAEVITKAEILYEALKQGELAVFNPDDLLPQTK